MKAVRASACALLLAGLAVAAPASAAVIDFSNLPGTNGDAFTSYSEDGFTLTYVSGQLFVAKVYGNPAPDLYFAGSAAFDITGGGLFTLGEFDGSIGGAYGLTTYQITGFLNNVATFSQSLSTTADDFVTLTPSSGSQVFDRVRFTMSTASSSANIDNINLATAAAAPAVPEPATWAMMILGFGAVGAAVRRARRSPAVRHGLG